MIKRPKRDETEDDILRMQEEFLAEKAKNPNIKPAAQPKKVPKKSLFAQSREKLQQEQLLQQSASAPTTTTNAAGRTEKTTEILGEIHEQIIGDINGAQRDKILDIVLGDIVEKHCSAPKSFNNDESTELMAFPKVDKMPLRVAPKLGKSFFALSMAAKSKNFKLVDDAERKRAHQSDAMDCEPIVKCNVNDAFGVTSVMVEDEKTASEVHKENLELLSKMKEEEILAERQKLLETIDPSLVALLAKRREMRLASETSFTSKDMPRNVAAPAIKMEIDDQQLSRELPDSNAAIELLQRSSAEHWINFDVVEKDKLEWLRDIPLQTSKLKPGEKFEARFDWKGVLLPYNNTAVNENESLGTKEKDERELYLHGEEPNRPGYTLQELFRLARSNVMQQRISALGAIAGILNIYHQGFYDAVLELPISKIFFLLRFALDDNTPAMLEVTAKALAYLFYNETDETLLDFIYDNPACYWQPTLQILQTDHDNDDPTSVNNLQKQMQQLQMNAKCKATASISAAVDESEEESKTTMSDFQLAETDLIDCLLRTNILQRIYFILNTVRPDNSTVSSCLKLLIRLARTSKEVTVQIVENDDLIKCLFDNFLPGLERVDTTLLTPPFYNYPQYLCLKLLRILISQNLSIALRLQQHNLIDKLQNYLYNREDIKATLIKLQIEALRVLRCLLLLRIDNTLYKKFLPAFRYMLEWHFNRVIYEEGGPYLLRQHAAALLAAVTSVTGGGLEVSSMLGNTLHDCCCNWFHKATKSGIKEFTQATLLSAALYAVIWYTRNCADAERFRCFNEKYLCDFITSQNFVHSIKTFVSSSIVLRQQGMKNDRRNVHPPLPNVGAVVMHRYGPQLIIPQTYCVYLLSTLWRLMEIQLEQNVKTLFDTLIKPPVIEVFVEYLQEFSKHSNTYLTTNFFAKAEVKLIFKLLSFAGFNEYFSKAQMLQMVYNFLCCLSAEHIPEIEILFERVIFNKAYLDVDEETLGKWRNTCLELVYPHYIVVSPTELTLSLPYTQMPILPKDWPYFQLKIILQNYIENVQHQQVTEELSESEILCMTLRFVAQLEASNAQLQIVSPTEKLMYLMIAFMGPDSQFLETDMHKLLHQHILGFYEKCKDCTFEFDAIYEGKCKFENLYALFVDHFQAASYGDELFSSLVMIPLAQKYDNKWRRRMWSDYASALRFLNCEETLLLGGLQAYLEPPEEEESLVKAYATALNSNLVRPNTLPYRIAKHHLDKFKERRLNK